MQTLGTGARMCLRAGRFVQRKPQEAWLLLRMAGWVAALSILIRWWPLPRALRVVAPQRRPAQTRAGYPAERLAQLLDLLLGLDLLVFTPTCWKRAPVLHRYLTLNGVETRIVFGVRKEGGDVLAGHAWLEQNGRPVFERSAPDYVITYAYPN